MTEVTVTKRAGPLAQLHAALCRRCCPALLAVTVGLLVIPVSLQIFSRYTELIPSYIWTEEMARFMFIWTIMIGAMIGVREFDPFRSRPAGRRCRRAARRSRGCSGGSACSSLAFVFVSAGIEFTHFAWKRTSELADLPLWYIHVAWPVTGVTWILFLGEQCSPTSRSFPGELSDGFRAVAGNGGAHPVRLLLLLHVPARAGRVRARARLPADPGDRAAARHDESDAGDVQRLQLVHPARGAVLPADRQPDERRRHHRPAAEAFARDGRAFPRRARADQRGAVDLLCRHFRLVDRGCREPVEDLHRGADQGGLRPLLLGRDHGGVGGARRDHPALDPDDRVGRHPDGVDRRAVPRRHHSGPADRARADGDRARLRQGARLSDLSARDLARACLRAPGSRSRR